MATYRLPSSYERVPLRRRAGGLSMALAINLIVILLLIGISTRDYIPVTRGSSKVFDLDSYADDKSPKQEQQEKMVVKTEAKTPPRIKPPEIVIPMPPTITQPPEVKLDMVEMTKEEIQQTDKAMATRSADASAGGGRSQPDSQVVGRGPNGETLYAAEWMREPTDQELSFYLPKNAPNGYGVIACKTYPRFRVDDCVEIESKPASAKLARAVLNAAWQFKVRPPRKNGEPMIGEWVMIQITYERR